jgi:distribution and morphology protein 34
MHAKDSELPRHTRPSVLAADQPLVVPMLLRISDLKLRGIVVLVVSKTKGITLVFKNDPLESIVVSSTFDSVTSVRNFLQREIEKQLRNLFQEDLPIMIHNLSQRHIQNEQEKQRKKQQQEWKRERKTRSVYSDPGLQARPFSPITPPSTLPLDILSMPDLSSSPTTTDMQSSFFDSLSQGQTQPSFYGSFSDLYYSHSTKYPPSLSSNAYSGSNMPITDANLSALNELYSSRFAALKSPVVPTGAFSDDDLEDDEDDDDDYLSNPTTSSINSTIYYADEDAPWYVTEGPELPVHDQNEEEHLSMVEDITVDPTQNKIAAKLAQLACHNHTISPFAHTIDHFTFRSLPHTVKVESRTRSNKTPKRRIIRLDTKSFTS